MRRQMIFLLSISIFVLDARASLSGLYATLPGTGQLKILNWKNGSTKNIGPPLASAGLTGFGNALHLLFAWINGCLSY